MPVAIRTRPYERGDLLALVRARNSADTGDQRLLRLLLPE